MKYIKDVAIAETIFINIIKENRKKYLNPDDMFYRKIETFRYRIIH